MTNNGEGFEKLGQIETKCVKIRKVEFGSGMPKICVPIVAKTREEVLLQASAIVKKEPDCIEFRADWYEDTFDKTLLLHLLQELRELIGNTVLLFTFRTKGEGGEQSTSVEEYRDLCKCVCESGFIDLLDVEGYLSQGLLSEICAIAHENHVLVVASNHDFNKTPSEEEIIKRLHFMDEEGADIPKIAVMPETERDVITLLSATLRYRETGGTKPIITMSMGGKGLASRLIGEMSGSALTFAAGVEVSAPGQIPIEKVKLILNTIYTYK